MRGPAVVVALAGFVAACGQDTIDVRAVDRGDPGDYGRSALHAARAQLAGQAEAPAAYAAFSRTVLGLWPRMTESVQEEAELALMVGARGPMERYHDADPAEQMATLGVTVWPTLYEVPAREGETPAAYLERVCGGELALECRHYVPEARPPVMASYAWERLHTRTRNAVSACATCEGDASYTELIDLYRRRASEADRRAFAARGAAERSDWPIAGEGATPWTEPLVFRKTDPITLGGELVSAGGWRQAMTAARGDRTVLGVYLRPSEKVQVVRAIAADAAAAGYRELALAVRGPEYPWPLREYRLHIGRRAPGYPVRVRDVETVQSLVQAIDATAAARGPAVRLATR